MLQRSVRRGSVFLFCSAIAAAVVAQTQPAITSPSLPLRPSQRDEPDQEFLRQQERERILRRQQEPSPDVRLPGPAEAAQATRLPAGESPCFSIDRVVLAGDGTDRFQWALNASGRDDLGRDDPVIGRCLGTAGINLAMRRMQNAILNRGFVTTRVLAEAQDLSGGTLKLTLVPGRIRAIGFAPGSDTRATQWNAVPAAPGDLLNLRDTEQALENFKRVPTAEADIQIVPAEGQNARPGESDLVIQWKQGLPWRLSMSADDSGTRSTGTYQGGLTLSYDHWWTLNDLFYVSFNHNLDRGADAHGTHGLVLHYSLPFGYWLLGATASDSNYRQSVAGLNQTYTYSGASQNSEIKLSRLVYRDAARKSTLSLRLWQRASQNYIDDTEVEVQRRRMAGWEIGLGHREFLGRATLDANVQYRRGTGARGALAAPEEVFGEGSSRFRLWMADANLGLPFELAGQKLRYAAAWRMQMNRTPLVAQDRFSIGGRYTVRGFDGESSLSAERGWLLRNDLGLTLGASGHELYAGLDHGEVGGQASDFLAARRLSGAVVGLRGSIMRLQYDVFIGRPVHQPVLFHTAPSTAGFNLNASF
jgi:hemolysin activation/secretion protein